MSSKDNQSKKATSSLQDQSDMSCVNNLLSALQGISPTVSSTLFSSSIVTSGNVSTHESTTFGKTTVLNDAHRPLPSSSVFLKKNNKMQIVNDPLNSSKYQSLKTDCLSNCSHQPSLVFQKDSRSPESCMSIKRQCISTSEISHTLLTPQKLSRDEKSQGLTNSSQQAAQSFDQNAAIFGNLNFTENFCLKDKTTTPVYSKVVTELHSNPTTPSSVLSPEDFGLWEPSLLQDVKDPKLQKQPNYQENELYGFFSLSPDNESDGEKCSILRYMVERFLIRFSRVNKRDLITTE